MAKTECAVCTEEIEVLERFIGEMMCQTCFSENKEVFINGEDLS